MAADEVAGAEGSEAKSPRTIHRPKTGPFGPNRSADASVMKRPVSPGDQLAGDLAHGIVTEDVDGAVLRLQRPLRGRPQGWLGAP